MTYKTSALHIVFIIYFHGVRADERECTETYWEGHERAFEFFGSVPEPEQLRQQQGPESHYLVREHFCRVMRANEKGVVEAVVKYARLDFLVPVPQVDDLEELNRSLVLP